MSFEDWRQLLSAFCDTRARVKSKTFGIGRVGDMCAVEKCRGPLARRPVPFVASQVYRAGQ